MERIIIRYPLFKRLVFVVLAIAFPAYVAMVLFKGGRPAPPFWAFFAVFEGLFLTGVVVVSRFAIGLDEQGILYRELVTKRIALEQVLAVRVEKGKRRPPFYTKRTLVGLAGIGSDGRLVAINVEWGDADLAPFVGALQQKIPGKVVVLERF